MQDSDTQQQTEALTGSTYRDIQRMALRDLVILATDCATTEEQIERRYEAELEAARKDMHRANLEVDTRFKAMRAALEREHEQRMSQIEARYQQDMKALTAADRAARQRAQIEYEAAERDIRQKVEQAVWLAESVYDGEQAKIREDAKAARAAYEEQIQQIEQLERETIELLQLYGQALMLSQMPDVQGAPVSGNAAEAYAQRLEGAREAVRALRDLRVPRLFVGARPALLVLLLCALAAAGTQAAYMTLDPQLKAMAIAVGAALALATVLGFVLQLVGKSHVRAALLPLRQILADAREAAAAQLEEARKAGEARLAAALATRKAEEQAARDRAAPVLQEAARRRDAALAAAQAEFETRRTQIQQRYQQARAQAEEEYRKAAADLQQRYDNELAQVRQRHAKQVADSAARHAEARAALERRLKEGLATIQAPIVHTSGQRAHAWDDPIWSTWTPPRDFAPMVPIGRLHVDLTQIADSVPRKAPRRLELPGAFTVPVSLAFPRQASLLIQTDREGREDALRALQMVMVRLLTCLPAGRVRFTLIDPIGLGQSFAGFMHLADHDEALVGGRIWTEKDQIEQRLTDLTEHMETVIQKYLRNEFETIDQYNAQAGELAEPYRFLVIADFPAGFDGEAANRLRSIANTGARCGVYTLVMYDARQPLPAGFDIESLEATSVTLVREGGAFVWKDEVFKQFPLTLDPPPPESVLTTIMEIVGRHARQAKRVEVPFEVIAPAEDQIWSASSTREVAVPMGRLGATRLQSLSLGRGVAQHALIAGKTGSGKSTLLHVLITNLALWYPPDQVEFYLVDFKKGVEFKTYATHVLPHARAIAVESDREFGLSVLQRVDAELSRRGELFRKLGVQDIQAFREADPHTIMPRTLLIIDEFQEFFSEDDKIAQDAALLLDRLVRQGRAFGIHVILGSQTIGGTSGLARSTIGQMAVRIALQCSEADSQMILGDNNSAARLLSRPGEAIYNDAGGLVEHNSPFQISWLSEEQREAYLAKVLERSRSLSLPFPPTVVFEGNAPAELSNNAQLASLLQSPSWPPPVAAPAAWLGEPVAIKGPTAVLLRRQSGSNVLIIGQQDEPAMAIMAAALISLAAQHSPATARFYVMDGSPVDSPLAKVFPAVAAAIPHNVRLVAWREVPSAINELAMEVQRRQESDHHDAPSIYVFIYGLQRYRFLRRQEETFSLTASDEDKAPAPDKQFADILREGPPLGIHVLAWADTPVTVERTFDRPTLREFDNRVLFQMSASDSSNLIDSPLANRLGFHRALVYSEELGTLEKFRPYGLVTSAFLERVRQCLAARQRPAAESAADSAEVHRQQTGHPQDEARGAEKQQ